MEHLGSQNPTTKRGCINNKTTELNNTQKKSEIDSPELKEKLEIHIQKLKKIKHWRLSFVSSNKKTKEGIMKKKKNRRSLKN